jgi:periplasmic protein TonB
MVPTKETLQTTTSETAVSQANGRSKQDSTRMRSDAVSLEVPVKVHGSRVDGAASGATSKSEPFEEQTSTMIVFPQGGVLKMATPVKAGQMMVVTNLKSGHDSICRVIQVRAYGQGQSYVEIEFTHRQPGYWGVYFPSDGPEVANQSAPVSPAPPVPPPTEIRVEKKGERSAPDASVPASVSKPPMVKSAGPTAKPDSVFAPIGSQEQVQPAASATSSRVKSSSLAELDGKHGSSALDSLGVETSSPAASVSIGELQGDMDTAPAFSFAGAGVPGELAEVASVDRARPGEHSAPLGYLAASAALGGGHARESFGSGLGSSVLGRKSQASQSKNSHGAAISVSAVVLVAAALGAAYYFHFLSFGSRSAAKQFSGPTAPPIQAVTPQPSASQPGIQPSAGQTNPPTLPSATSGAVSQSVPSGRASMAASASPKPPKNVPAPTEPQPGAPATAASDNSAAKVPDMFGALHAHPTSRASSADAGPADAAPAIDAPAAETSDAGLPASVESSVVAPPSPEPESPVRIRVGGELKPPRLLSSVLPVYPAVARDAGVEGDVVIDTTIDKSGKVTATKVVSGPPMLRQAALEALRQWKYEPSKLNGEPVPVQMTVTIKFHRQ